LFSGLRDKPLQPLLQLIAHGGVPLKLNE
jgi:hypothetical protein